MHREIGGDRHGGCGLTQVADLIDAAWVLGGGQVFGDSGSGDYTTIAYVEGVGKGATITPAEGDTGKTLFVPNTGSRPVGGNDEDYGRDVFFWPVTGHTDANAWRCGFYITASVGRMAVISKLNAYSLRCVRS